MFGEILAEAIFGAFVSEVVSDCTGITKDKIKEAVKNKKNKHQTLESQIYNIIVDALNEFTYEKYKGQDILFDAVEKILKGFKDNRGDNLDAVRNGLSVFEMPIDNEKCENFKKLLYREICKSDDLYKKISLLKQDQQIESINSVIEGMDKVKQIVTEIKENGTNDGKIQDCNTQQRIKSKTQEYADKWNANMFLNNFNKRDENAGVNVKLSEVYLDEHLPHYVWRGNANILEDLKKLLFEYIDENNDKKMLLVLGQPGIGKSTLITWITANFSNRVSDILVYQFASDLKNINKCNLDKDKRKLTLGELSLSFDDLEGKILILDGFDEISVEKDRGEVLNYLYKYLIKNNLLEKFWLIITCRENYIQNMDRIECDYITLQPWESNQIRNFCEVYSRKTKCNISKDTMTNILKNKDILGIPLILYMILALDISVEEEGSIVDVYDQIFSLKEGGIYERCFVNMKKNKLERYDEAHWIYTLKRQIHQISRDISIWMFENNSEEAYIPQKEYRKICIDVIHKQEIKKIENIEQDILIGTYFKLIRHCEGIETERLYFVHRSIYEYFVVETIYNSIENSMIILSDESQEEFGGNIAIYLKQGRITYTIGKYLKHKIVKLYNKLNSEKQERFYQWWENTIGKMMDVGMFYYTKLNMRSYIDIIHKECQCFVNLVEILRLLLCISKREYIMKDISRAKLKKYIQYCWIEFGNDRKLLNFSKMYLLGVNLSNIVLSYMNLSETYMKGVDLRKTSLEGANLSGADLSGVNLIEANLKGAGLSEVNLRDANLNGANLRADLSGVNLSGAILIDAGLIDANLIDTNLSGANLNGANLKRANLKGVNLSGAILNGANLEGSIWYKNELKKILLQLKKANFIYIIMEDQGEQKKLYRNELFPDEM